MALREGLSFSDYFDDSVPYEVKPVHSTIPMQEEDDYVGNSDIPVQSKDLFKGLHEDSLHNSREYWLNPQAKLLNATNKGHERWAEEYLTAHNIKYDICDNYEPYLTMYELGFIRVKTMFSEIHYNYSTKANPTNAQLRLLRDSAIESDMKLMYQIFNPDKNEFGSIVTVNLDESLMLEAVLSDGPSGGAYWLDSNCNFHEAPNGHQTWAENYLNTHKIPYYSRDAYLKDYRDGVTGCYKTMFKLKFVRIYFSTYNSTKTDILYAVNDENNISDSQIRELRNSAIESNAELKINNKSMDIMEKYVNKDARSLFIESMMPDNIDTFKTHLAQLFAYLQKELQLKSVPSVKLISDEKNADKVLGKTAYYNPDEKLIVLYIVNRHQKDILRSFAHEVIHHWQHENEKLNEQGESPSGAKDPQYAQNNPWLRQMEKQAYLLGNMLFRDWEDQKKAKDKKSGYDGKSSTKKNKQVTEKTYSLGNQYPPKKMDYRG